MLGDGARRRQINGVVLALIERAFGRVFFGFDGPADMKSPPHETKKAVLTLIDHLSAQSVHGV